MVMGTKCMNMAPRVESIQTHELDISSHMWWNPFQLLEWHPSGGLLTNSVHSDMHMKEDQLTLVTIIASFCLPTVEVAVYEMYVDTVIWKAPEATSYRALQVAHLGSPEQYISAGTSAVM